MELNARVRARRKGGIQNIYSLDFFEGIVQELRGNPRSRANPQQCLIVFDDGSQPQWVPTSRRGVSYVMPSTAPLPDPTPATTSPSPPRVSNADPSPTPVTNADPTPTATATAELPPPAPPLSQAHQQWLQCIANVATTSSDSRDWPKHVASGKGLGFDEFKRIHSDSDLLCDKRQYGQAIRASIKRVLTPKDQV